MKQKIYIFIFAFVLTLSFGSFERILACSCISFSTCGMYHKADTIFVGKVADSTDKVISEERVYDGSEISNETQKVTYAQGIISIDVLESFKGAKKDLPIILKDRFLTTCSFRFKLDETYLIYAFKDEDGNYSTSICTPTKLLSKAKEDLEFLRNPPKSGVGAKVFGKVYESINDYSEENLSAKPFEKVNIQIQSTTDPKKKFVATTNSEGDYEINIPPGTYKIKPIIPAYFKSNLLSYNDSELIEAKDRKCENRNFRIENDSEIAGKVLDVNGKPVENITIKLFRENTAQSDIAFGEWATTDEKGNFSFKHISLGRYFLAVNFDDAPEDKLPYATVFYPNVKNQDQAQVFEISNGTKHNKVVFLLPSKLKKVKVEGQVTFKDGKLASDVEVNLYDEQFNSTDNFKKIKTDANGKFVLEGFEGRKYFVRAIIWTQVSEVSKIGSAQGESEVFILDSNTPKIKIVLEEVPDMTLPTEPDEDQIVPLR